MATGIGDVRTDPSRSSHVFDFGQVNRLLSEKIAVIKQCVSRVWVIVKQETPTLGKMKARVYICIVDNPVRSIAVIQKIVIDRLCPKKQITIN
jgi:hypothetical protein